jgi:hypothetical protein
MNVYKRSIEGAKGPYRDLFMGVLAESFVRLAGDAADFAVGTLIKLQLDLRLLSKNSWVELQYVEDNSIY